MLRTFILPIQEVIRESSDAISICLAQPLVDRIPYLPGQYVTIKVLIEGVTHYRTYSLSSTPRLDRFLSLTIKRVAGGKVSNYLNDYAEKGQLLEFLRPGGNFLLKTATSEKRRIILIGGGSGITPLMSMLRAVLYHEPYSRVSLLYASRKREDTIFRQRLESLQAKFPDRLQLRIWLSSETLPIQSDIYQAGRMQAEDIQQLLNATQQDALPQSFFLCGPAGLMQMAEQTLLKADIQPASIAKEKFVVDEEIRTNQQALDGPTHTVEIIFGEETHHIKVPPGTTILQAAQAQGVDLPYSCRRGICAACMSRLLDGQVDMDNPEALLEFEKVNGKVLTCQAHPTTEGVRIRIGD